MNQTTARPTVDQIAFLKFVFKGQKPPARGRKLTEGQNKIYELTLQGLTPKKISTSKKITLGSVYDSLTKIREKGWQL